MARIVQVPREGLSLSSLQDCRHGDRYPDAHPGRNPRHAPRTAAESYSEVTIKAMAVAIERLPRIEV